MGKQLWIVGGAITVVRCLISYCTLHESVDQVFGPQIWMPKPSSSSDGAPAGLELFGPEK
jgi:hypothetical protein